MADELAPQDPPDVALMLASPLPLDRNPAAVYVASLTSATSRRTMMSALKTIAEALCPGATVESVAWHRLRYQHGVALRSKLAATLAPRTVNKLLSALRGVIEQCVNLGLMTDGEGAWRSRVHGQKPDDELTGRALEGDEVAAMLAACGGGTLSDARDAAVVSLLFGGGLRRSEAAGVYLSDFDDKRGRVRVLGKGNKRRTVQLAPDGAAAVRSYVALRGDAPGPLLVSFDLQGRVRLDVAQLPAGLTESGLYDVFVDVAKRAGIEKATPHDARRSRITRMIDDGVSLAHVRREAGHRSSKTTDRYDRTKEESAHRAAARVGMVDPDPDSR